MPSSWFAATLAPFWDGALRGQVAQQEEGGKTLRLPGKALRAAEAVADAATAAMLLRPFRIGNLTDANLMAFAKIAGDYDRGDQRYRAVRLLRELSSFK